MVYNTASGWNVVCWNVVFCHRRAEKELEAMAVDIRADFARIVQMIETYGLNNMREPQITHLVGKIWEMRMRGRDGIARAYHRRGKASGHTALLCKENAADTERCH